MGPWKQKREHALAVKLPQPIFNSGLRPDTVICPRCEGLLEREIAFFRCRLCGQLFRIRGADYGEQGKVEARTRTFFNEQRRVGPPPRGRPGILQKSAS